MHADSDQAEIDAHIEYWSDEGEGTAQYDAWRHSLQPYDFTGASYLEEYTRLLREKTPLMERFARFVECNRETSAEFEEFSLEPDRQNLLFMLEIDRQIFEDGDEFLQCDQDFLGDQQKVETLALGEVLAETSIRHGCLEFWPRLREMGPTPQMVREAKGWWLLASIDMEPK